jgi:hypothetical protein
MIMFSYKAGALQTRNLWVSLAEQMKIVCVPGAMELRDKENGNNTP